MSVVNDMAPWAHFVSRCNTSRYEDSGTGPDPGAPVDITMLGLLLSAALFGINAIISLSLRLGMHSRLAMASIRCFIQLSLLGYILLPIFQSDKLWLSAVYCSFMVIVAAVEAVSRPRQTYSGMLLQVLGTLGMVCTPCIIYGLILVVGVEPWYDAQYLIPMLGMLLGNACSGVAVGLSAVLEELSSGRDKVEMLLALGATRLEATQDVIKQAARMALTPLLNQMNVVGVVSIPGMMTGQILGGSDPATAARYQIIIMFLIGTATGLSSVATIFAAVFSLVDSKHRLHADKMVTRDSTAGALGWITAQCAKVRWLEFELLFNIHYNIHPRNLFLCLSNSPFIFNNNLKLLAGMGVFEIKGISYLCQVLGVLLWRTGRPKSMGPPTKEAPQLLHLPQGPHRINIIGSELRAN